MMLGLRHDAGHEAGRDVLPRVLPCSTNLLIGQNRGQKVQFALPVKTLNPRLL